MQFWLTLLHYYFLKNLTEVVPIAIMNVLNYEIISSACSHSLREPDWELRYLKLHNILYMCLLPAVAGSAILYTVIGFCVYVHVLVQKRVGVGLHHFSHEDNTHSTAVLNSRKGKAEGPFHPSIPH